MKKICFAVQRYGREVNGGAELQCRLFAEKLTDYYDVTVLTSKAIDYVTWKNEYKQDEEEINGVRVIRFNADKERVPDDFNEISARFLNEGLREDEEQEWIDRQGPYMPELIQYLHQKKDEYAAFIFITYLYYQSVMGIPAVADKAIVVPEAHDEPYLKMKIFRNVFLTPRFFFFNTDEERELVRLKFNNYHIPCLLGGAGVDIPANVDGERFKRKYGVENYIVYVGRIDERKNCGQMFDFFARYKKEHPKESVKLVLMGKAVTRVPSREDIVSLGFVSEEDKFDGIAGARLLLLPSVFESLSIVVLEAFSLRIPVLVNGNCKVLEAHIKKSGAGYTYYEYRDFSEKMADLLNNVEKRLQMGLRGEDYVERHYQWNLIIRKLSYLIERI